MASNKLPLPAMLETTTGCDEVQPSAFQGSIPASYLLFYDTSSQGPRPVTKSTDQSSPSSPNIYVTPQPQRGKRLGSTLLPASQVIDDHTLRLPDNLMRTLDAAIVFQHDYERDSTAGFTIDDMIYAPLSETQLQFSSFVGLDQSICQGMSTIDPRTESFEFMTGREESSSLALGDKQRSQGPKGSLLGDDPVFSGIPDSVSPKENIETNLDPVLHNDRWLTFSSPINQSMETQFCLALRCPHPSCNSKVLFKQFLDAIGPIQNIHQGLRR
ncbi:hypothetical protein V2A60_008461 [Cordyceps javanica]